MRLSLVDAAGDEVATFSFDEATGLWTWRATGTEPEGRLRAFASRGAIQWVSVGELALDFTPPALVTSAVRVLPSRENALVVAGFPSLVSAARPGEGVEVTFELTERVQQPLFASLRGADAGVALTITPVGSAFLASASLPPQLAGGSYTAQLDVADAVGNRAQLPLGSVDVITSKPPPPDVEADALVVFRRAPWGTLDDPTPRYSLTGAMSDAVALEVSSGPYIIGRGAVDGDGGFDIALTLAGDLERVSVRALDPAGNASPWAEVREVEWVISAVTADAGYWLETPTLSSYGGTWQLARPAGGVVRTAGGPVLRIPNLGFSTWLMTTRQGVVGNQNLFWKGELLVGTGFGVPSCPQQRRLLAYDPIEGNWACMGRGAPVQLADGGAFTDGRIDGRVAFVPPARAWMVLGGTLNGAPASLGYWVNRTFRGTVTGALPSRSAHAMQWDETHQQVLIFGGRGDDGGLLADTWAWADGGFVELSSGPPARWGAALGWDERERRMVLAGGVLADGSLATDTWVHDGRTWAALDAGSYQPRLEPWLNVSQVPTIMLLSGGLSLDGGAARRSDGGLLGPEVLVDGRWSTLPEQAPWGGGARPAMGRHPELGMLAVGGAQLDEICGESYCDYFTRMTTARLWRWADWGWHPLSGDDAGAPLHSGGTLSWSPSRGELLLHQGTTYAGPGSELDTTLVRHPWHLQYRWSLDAGWRIVDLIDAGAPALPLAFLWFDEATDRLLVHGGVLPDGGSSPQTWEQLPSGAWYRLENGPARLFSLEGGSVASTASGQSILASNSGTWSFDGRWTAIPRAPALPLTRHPLTGQAVALDDRAWVWSGSSWNSVGSWDINLVQTASGVGVDSPAGQLVFAGPSTGVLDFVNTRPAHLFTVPLGLVCPFTEGFRSAEIRARGGAFGSDGDGGMAAGAELVVRRAGRVEPVGWCAGNVTTPASCSATFDDAAALARWLTREGGFQDVQVGMASGSRGGTWGSLVQTEGLEFRLRYRRDAGAP